MPKEEYSALASEGEAGAVVRCILEVCVAGPWVQCGVSVLGSESQSRGWQCGVLEVHVALIENFLDNIVVDIRPLQEVGAGVRQG